MLPSHMLKSSLFIEAKPQHYVWTGSSIIIFKGVEEAREGNGTPLQYSCLESPMDGGAW